MHPGTLSRHSCQLTAKVLEQFKNYWDIMTCELLRLIRMLLGSIYLGRLIHLIYKIIQRTNVRFTQHYRIHTPVSLQKVEF